MLWKMWAHQLLTSCLFTFCLFTFCVFTFCLFTFCFFTFCLFTFCMFTSCLFTFCLHRLMSWAQSRRMKWRILRHLLGRKRRRRTKNCLHPSLLRSFPPSIWHLVCVCVVGGREEREGRDSSLWEDGTDLVFLCIYFHIFTHTPSHPHTHILIPLTHPHTVSPKQTRLPSISEVKMPPDQPSELGVKRRTKLPYPVVDVGDFSLWSFLRKNIGQNQCQGSHC